MTQPVSQPMTPLPCPFCGGEPDVRTVGTMTYVECKICHCASMADELREPAIAFWNRRVSSSPTATMPTDEHVVRDGGMLKIEHVPAYLPSEAEEAKALASLAKAWPVLAKHADHTDGEFNNALGEVRRMFKGFRALIDRLRSAPVEEPPTDDKRDAGRWRKLMGCGRMMMLGSAGKPPHHMGLDFWHKHPEPSRPETVAAFTDFVDRAPSSSVPDSPAPTHNCGASGFDPMKGDICPGCNPERAADWWVRSTGGKV